MGPMSGRAAGYCAGFGMPGYMNPMSGRGFGMGRGRGWWAHGFGAGRGWRNCYYATGLPGWKRRAGRFGFWGYPVPFEKPDSRSEKEALEREAEILRAQLDLIEKRLSKLQNEASAQREQA
jgi:hypothetical protein